MSSRGGYAPPSRGGDRFYHPPAVRRHHHHILLQQEQVMQRQLPQQQQQRLPQRKPATARESSAAAEAEALNDSDASSVAVALSVPPCLAHDSALSVTNLDRLIESVTPFVEARDSLEVNASGRSASDVDSLPFYYLKDLWAFFTEWSYYGAGVPLLLNGKDQIEQYYVPFLSGIQLYIDPSNPSSRLGRPNEEIDATSYKLTSGDAEGDKLGKTILETTMQEWISSAGFEVAGACGPPSFQFLEYEQPYNRRPLVDKISLLVLHYPELSNLKSCDLLPSSWMCVAWYPIYRIPVGPTLRDLDASFLTFHSLSTQLKSHSPPRFHAPNARNIRGIVDSTPRFSLPVFALSSYKLKGSIVSPCGPHECERENSLLQAADRWLDGLDVTLPDYQFFRAHYSQMR